MGERQRENERYSSDIFKQHLRASLLIDELTILILFFFLRMFTVGIDME